MDMRSVRLVIVDTTFLAVAVITNIVLVLMVPEQQVLVVQHMEMLNAYHAIVDTMEIW